jgi:hypothetical protein
MGARRLAIPLLVATAQLAAAVTVLGLPSLPAAEDFFVSRAPTFASAIAASQLTVWVIVAVTFGWSLALAAGAALPGMGEHRRKLLWSSLVMVAGLLILVAGLGHHAGAGAVSMSGGSLQEASQELAR